MNKPLTHAKDENGQQEVWDKPLVEGDFAIFQCFKEEDPEWNNMPTIAIRIVQIESIDIEGETVRFKDEPDPQPIYRIRSVMNVETAKTYMYEGYDYERIAMDEGEMTQETYEAIKEFRKSQDMSGAL